MGGWNDVGMVRKYAHLAPDHLQDYAERLCQPKLVKEGDMVQRTSTNLAQSGTGEKNSG